MARQILQPGLDFFGEHPTRKETVETLAFFALAANTDSRARMPELNARMAASGPEKSLGQISLANTKPTQAIG